MPARPLMARWFLIGGGALALAGLVLWLALPIQSAFPPFLPTALLALAYGAACLWRGRPGAGRKP